MRCVLGLSGGVDSATALAVDALGADAVLGIAMPSRCRSAARDALLVTGIELRDPDEGALISSVPLRDRRLGLDENLQAACAV